MANKPFKIKGSPAKFIGMGVSKMIRDKFRGTGVGNLVEKVAGSGMLGIGGTLLAGGQNDQGAGEAVVPPHTHGDETAMTKKGSPISYTPYKMKGSPMQRNFGINSPINKNDGIFGIKEKQGGNEDGAKDDGIVGPGSTIKPEKKIESQPQPDAGAPPSDKPDKPKTNKPKKPLGSGTGAGQSLAV